jgi:hypothetical protein
MGHPVDAECCVGKRGLKPHFWVVADAALKGRSSTAVGGGVVVRSSGSGESRLILFSERWFGSGVATRRGSVAEAD